MIGKDCFPIQNLTWYERLFPREKFSREVENKCRGFMWSERPQLASGGEEMFDFKRYFLYDDIQKRLNQYRHSFNVLFFFFAWLEFGDESWACHRFN